MSNEMALFSYDAKMIDISQKKHTQNYLIPCGDGNSMTLERDTDFGVIPGTKKPSLYKSGAEKICMSLGLCQRYELVSRLEDPENGFFSYTVRCDLVKIVDGTEYVIVSSYGASNTRERRTGSQSAFDGQNSALKMAQKRALVGAAIVVGGLSNLFAQDIENEDYLKEGLDAYSTGKGPITASQVRFLYSKTSRAGMTTAQAKQFLKDKGYKSAKEIQKSDFEGLLEEIRKAGEEENGQ